MVLLKGLHFINLTLKLAQYLYPLSSFWHLNCHFPFLLLHGLTFKARKAGVTFSLESLIRLTQEAHLEILISCLGCVELAIID